MANEYQKPLLCPFCGSDDIIKSEWYLDGGEVEAMECQSCYAGAPTDAWNQRVNRVFDCSHPIPVSELDGLQG